MASGRRETARACYVGLENDDEMAVIDTATNKRHHRSPDRPGPAGHRLRGERRAGGRRDGQSSAARREPASVANLTLKPRDGEAAGAHQRQPVRPGTGADRAGIRHGIEGRATLCPGVGPERRRHRRIEPIASFTANPAGAVIVEHGRPDPPGCPAASGRPSAAGWSSPPARTTRSAPSFRRKLNEPLHSGYPAAGLVGPGRAFRNGRRAPAHTNSVRIVALKRAADHDGGERPLHLGAGAGRERHRHEA